MKKETKEDVFSKVIANEKAAFIIDQQQFEDNLQLMQSSFLTYYPKVTIGYSYKTNYIPVICKTAHKNGCWAEVVSEMEVEMALLNLETKSNIIYNGPIKSPDSIKKVIVAGGIINVDHILDLNHIEKIIAASNGEIKRAKIALRVNFEYEGQVSRFGLEKDKINEFIKIIEDNPALELLGYHIHLPFRTLESYKFRVESLIDILRIHGNKPLKYINIGGGFFGRISPELAESLNINNIPDYKAYGQLIGLELSDYFKKSDRKEWPELFIEPGSSVIADALWFISKIHTVKQINQKNILVTYAGRHLLTPTNKTIQFPIELYQTSKMEFNHISNDLFVAGYTCIESDILGKVKSSFVSKFENFVAISNVGSYSIVMGSDFILPQPAIYNYSDVGLKIIRHTKTAEIVMAEFVD
jgi:diaminopimelate decarboxylase